MLKKILSMGLLSVFLMQSVFSQSVASAVNYSKLSNESAESTQVIADDTLSGDNNQGNVSEESNQITTNDVVSVTLATSSSISYKFQKDNTILLTWEEPTAKSKVKSYEVYRDGVKIATVKGLSYADKVEDIKKSYEYYVRSLDKDGNIITESTHIIITYELDTIAPSTPTSLDYEVVSGSSIVLMWSAATDNVKVAGYEVYRDGNKIGYTEETSYVDRGLTIGDSYTYEVIAVDLSGNISAKSEALSVTVEELEEDNEYSSPTDFKTNRYIIKYKNKTGSTKLKKDIKNNVKSSHKVKNKKNEEIEVIVLKKKVRPNEFVGNVKKLKNNKNATLDYNNDIEYIQPDYQLNASSTDTYFNQQWGISNSVDSTPAFNSDPELASDFDKDVTSVVESEYKVDASVLAAWDKTKGNGVVVAVLDTGIDITQEDLVSNIWTNTKEIPNNNIDDDGNGYIDDKNGWNFVDETNMVHNPSNINDEWHGTHIAGIIAAQGNNNTGITGVAPEAMIMPLKVFSNGTAYTSDIVAAIEYAEQMGVKIVNCSWGSTDSNTALKEAIYNSSMLFVCAAGNNHANIDTLPVYPASYDSDNIITVASVNSEGILSGFTNYGEKSVDIVAPGEDIISTTPNNKYITTSGTSMAAAFISGEAALLLSMNEKFNVITLKERILTTSDRLSTLTGKIVNGNKLNCTNAIFNEKSNDVIELDVEDKNDYSTNNYVSDSDYKLYGNGTWSTKANYPLNVSGIKAVTVNGRLFAISGWLSNAVYEYIPTSNAWVQRANMITGRSGHGIAAVNGKIYAIGGYDSSVNRLNSVEEYDPATNTWTLKANMPTAREGVTCAVVNNIIYVMGGYNGSILNIVEAYDPATNTWSTKPSMSSSRWSGGASSINGKIYVSGGYFNNSLEMYNPSTNSWTIKASMSTPRGDVGVEALNGRLYAFGGYGNSSIVNSVEEYSPITNTWTQCPSMPVAKRYFGTAVLNNTIYTIGGYSGSNDISSVEAYTPITNTQFEEEWNTMSYASTSTNIISNTDGVLKVNSSTNDPMIHMYNIGSFNPNVFRYMEVRYKMEASTPSTSFEIFFTNSNSTTATGDQCVPSSLLKADGQWHTYYLDLWTNSRYRTGGNITGWRYDWATANNVTMELDYIRLVKKPVAYEEEWDMVPSFSYDSDYYYFPTGGILTYMSFSDDPMIMMYNLGSFDPNVFRYMEVKYKMDASTPSTNFEIFFTNDNYPTVYSGDQCVSSSTLIADGQWHTYFLDLWTNPRYRTGGNITGWRYDWATANNVIMELDYIRLVATDVITPVEPTFTFGQADSSGYKVYVNNAGIDTSRVLFPTWTSSNGQDDIVWHEGTYIGNNTWEFDVKISDHNNEYGEYNTHAYIVDRNGNYQGVGGAAFFVTTKELVYQYDENGRLTAILMGNKQIVIFTYDKNGNLISVTNVSN